MNKFLVLVLIAACAHGALRAPLHPSPRKYGSLLTPSGGTITAVTAGDGLTGGGAAGPVTVNVGAGSGVIVSADAVSADTSYVQKRIGGSCIGTNAIQTVNADGSVVCVAAGGGGGGGTVTNVATGNGITGGPITTTGTVALANTAVTAGNYMLPAITVDAQGRLTAASSYAGTSCGAGTAIQLLSTAGAASCIAVGTGTVTGSGSTGQGARWTGPSAIGNASFTDDGTTLTTTALADTVDSHTLPSGSVTLNPATNATIERLTCDGVSGTQINAMSTSTNGRVLDIEVVSGFCEFNASGSSGTIETPENQVVFLQGGVNGDDGGRAEYDSTLGKWAIIATGKITGVQAGTGLTNATGNTSGVITLSLNHPMLTCSAGQHFNSVNSAGTPTCSADAPANGITGTLTTGDVVVATGANAVGSLSGMTTNALVKASGAGAIANSSVTDDGTRVRIGDNLLDSVNTGSLLQIGTSSSGLRLGASGHTVENLGIQQTDGNSTLGSASANKTTLWGHLNGQGTKPTISACGTGSLTATSSDIDGTLLWDSTSTSCTLTFTTAYTNTPACTLTYYDSNAKGFVAQWIHAQSATAVTINQASASGSEVNYHCLGQQL